MTTIECAYIAGLFDGEGCISIRLNRPTSVSKHKSNLYALITKVTMCDEKIIRYLHNKFKLGHVNLNQRSETLRGKQRPAWSWTCMSYEAAIVLKQLIPYLISKKQEALIALEFHELPSARQGQKRVDDDLTKIRHDYYLRLREAKGRL